MAANIHQLIPEKRLFALQGVHEWHFPATHHIWGREGECQKNVWFQKDHCTLKAETLTIQNGLTQSNKCVRAFSHSSCCLSLSLSDTYFSFVPFSVSCLGFYSPTLLSHSTWKLHFFLTFFALGSSPWFPHHFFSGLLLLLFLFLFLFCLSLCPHLCLLCPPLLVPMLLTIGQ